ncbi:glycine, alanine and asparagine-rich protein-like [Gossypium australe]|uniref:Glycine, alanine and asparagine-rich protein-like n=1 Tax=Gossypium australe TaxID=47621 RepID=A0A5B6W7I8_9ROSI|nr:glycine, alanine and asparagine-rich protein-like [Gossypium australe]
MKENGERINMQHRKLVTDTSCPRCGERAETIDHFFRECLVTVEVVLPGVLNSSILINAAFLDVHFRQYGETETQEYIIKRKSAKIKETRSWRCPPRESVKINFDGAFGRQNNISASGIVARNDEGCILLSCSETHKEVTSAFAVEALACQKAVRMGLENTWPEVIVEGDSLVVIKKCNSKDQDKSMIGAYISDIQQMVNRKTINGTKHFVFKHIPRIANAIAHKIATETLKRKEEFYLEKKVPEYAQKQRFLEWVRKPD